MTREEALIEILKKRDKEDKIHYSKTYDIINKIYDDFENEEGDYYEGIEEGYNICKKEMVCRNCKYFIKTKKGLLCSNPTNYDYIITDENFGCNKFERKEE